MPKTRSEKTLLGAGEYWFMGGELCDAAIRVDHSELYVQSEMMEVQTWTPNWHNESYETTQLVLSTAIDKNCFDITLLGGLTNE